MANMQMYKNAGYTHYIAYRKRLSDMQIVECGFPTTSDAVNSHLLSLGQNDDVISVRVFEIL